MKISEYGKLVRKGRIDAGITMLDMAKSMGVSPSFLSATEVGTKKISDDFLNRVIEFFASKGIHISGIREAADVSNKAVSLEGLSTTQQFLVAGFARANMSKDQLDAFVKLLADTKKRRLNEWTRI